MTKRPMHCPRCGVLTPAVGGLYNCKTCGGFDPDGVRSGPAAKLVYSRREQHDRAHDAETRFGPIDGKPIPLTARIRR